MPAGRSHTSRPPTARARRAPAASHAPDTSATPGPSTPADPAGAVRPPLRPYQDEAVNLGEAHFAEHERGQLIADCGSGKTRMALEIADRLGARRILYAAPNVQLVNQIVKDIAAFHRGDPRGAPRFTVLCSDGTIGMALEDLAEPVLVTTDAADVDRILGWEREKELVADAHEEPIAPHYIVSTYHSLPVLAAATGPAAAIDFAIGDEIHRTTGEDATRPFRLLVQPKGTPGALRYKRLLVLTATPKDRPTPAVLPNRTRTVTLAKADADRVGLDAVAFIPQLEDAYDPQAYRPRLRPLLGLPRADGSVILVRALVPRPYIDPEATHPHELQHVLPGPDGQLHLDAPTIASSIIVPSEAAVEPMLRLVANAEGTPEALSDTQSFARVVEAYAARASVGYYMDDRALYGHIIADIPATVVSQAGYTAPYRTLLATVAQREVETLAPAVPAERAEDRRQIAATALVLSRAGARYDMQHAMAFHQRIQEANALAVVMRSPALEALNRAAGFPAATTLDAAPLHSAVPPKEQEARLAHFASRPERGTMRCLSGVRIGMEGQNIPAVDTIAFTAPRESAIEVVQIKGRASRLDPARPNKVASLVLPLIVDDQADVLRTAIATAIDPHSLAIAQSVMAALLTADERALASLQVDTLTTAPKAQTLTSPLPTPRADGVENAAEVRERAARYVVQHIAQECAGIAPRRYAGVSYDADRAGFHAYVARQAPNAKADQTPLVFTDSLHAVASDAGLAVDRVIDEQNLEGHLTRNFARPFTLAPTKRADGSEFRSVSKLRGSARGDGAQYVATYELRRLGGAKAGALAVRYAATAEDAGRIADALLVRYDGTGERNFPGEPARHDLAARPVPGRPYGVEYDAAVKRWWAFGHYPGEPGGPPKTVSLGFFASERDAEAAQRHVQVAFGTVPPQEASHRLLSRVARTALTDSGVLEIGLPTETRAAEPLATDPRAARTTGAERRRRVEDVSRREAVSPVTTAQPPIDV